VKSGAQLKTLEERLPAFGPDVAEVIRRVLYEEQRKLGLKIPRDIVTLVEGIVDETVSRAEKEEQ
jgi:capsid protein